MSVTPNQLQSLFCDALSGQGASAVQDNRQVADSAAVRSLVAMGFPKVRSVLELFRVVFGSMTSFLLMLPVVQ